ncbi:MAG TPA: GNAT family protein [Thermoleophilia bacterium]|nr:GNAT family protein [Thermoleophilia bacterium]
MGPRQYPGWMEIFAGEPVYLRPLEREEVLASLDFFRAEPEVSANLTWVLPLNNVESQERWLREMRESDRTYVFAIIQAAGGKHAGNIGLHDIDPKDRDAELGVFLFPEFRGIGLGQSAIRRLLLWGFQVRNLHRIRLRVRVYNQPARGLYRKLGFTREGVLREAYFLNGRFWDVEIWGMLEQEWRGLYPEDRLPGTPAS